MKRLLPLLLGVCSVACAGEDVVLLTVQSGGAAGASAGGTSQGGAAQGGAPRGGAAQGGNSEGGASGVPPPCRFNADCAAGFCQKSQCFDDIGHCERRDVICEGQRPAPVCGCDGITYYNDCWRRQAGVASSTSGECRSQAIQCGRSSDCPVGECAHLFAPGDPCSGPSPIPGTCWVVPDTCDANLASLDSVRFTECGGPNAGRCADTCLAVRLGHPFVKAPPGVCL